MPKQATLNTLPKGYKQTVTKSGDNTVVIRLTRDYDKHGKRIARTYILGPDGNTLQYAGYFTPSKKDTKSIFETRQNPAKEGRNKAIRNIASKATPANPRNPVKLDARRPKKAPKAESEAPSAPVEAPKAESEAPSLTQPESPADELETLLNEVHLDWFSGSGDDLDYVEPMHIDDEYAWSLVEPQEGEWSHDRLSELWNDDPVDHNINKINWLFLGFSDLKARGFLNGEVNEHDSLILRVQQAQPDILSEHDVTAIKEYTKRLTADEFNAVWEKNLDRMGMTNEELFKYNPDTWRSAYLDDAYFYHNLALLLRDEVEKKINDMFPDESFIIRDKPSY